MLGFGVSSVTCPVSKKASGLSVELQGGVAERLETVEIVAVDKPCG